MCSVPKRMEGPVRTVHVFFKGLKTHPDKMELMGELAYSLCLEAWK